MKFWIKNSNSKFTNYLTCLMAMTRPVRKEGAKIAKNYSMFSRLANFVLIVLGNCPNHN